MDAPGIPHYPEDPDLMEARLIEEIVQVQSQLGPDLLGPQSEIALRAASTEALGKQAGRYENLAMLYRNLAVRRSPCVSLCTISTSALNLMAQSLYSVPAGDPAGWAVGFPGAVRSCTAIPASTMVPGVRRPETSTTTASVRSASRTAVWAFLTDFALSVVRRLSSGVLMIVATCD
jgi:hypothetical protein